VFQPSLHSLKMAGFWRKRQQTFKNTLHTNDNCLHVESNVVVLVSKLWTTNLIFDWPSLNKYCLWNDTNCFKIFFRILCATSYIVSFELSDIKIVRNYCGLVSEICQMQKELKRWVASDCLMACVICNSWMLDR